MRLLLAIEPTDTSGVVARQVQAGVFGNTATVIATGPGGGSSSTQDPAYYRGTNDVAGIIVKKAVKLQR